MMVKENKTEKISLRITKELLKAVEQYGDDNEAKSRSEAVVMLIERGLRK